MNKTSHLLLLFITVALLAATASASTLKEVAIKDELAKDNSVTETLNITMTNNMNTSFIFVLPKGYSDSRYNDAPVESVNNTLNIPLKCTTCSFRISYKVTGVITDLGQNEFRFTRTLNLPQSPDKFTYSILLPVGNWIGSNNDFTEPPVIPQESKIDTDGKRIIVMWVQQSPVFPMIYSLRFHNQETNDITMQDFRNELTETIVYILMACSFVIGAVLCFGLLQAFHKKKKAHELPLIPHFLFSPDEKMIIKLLKDNNSTLNQKEIVRKLNWSKSKVSAIMTNLEYKKIVTREKFGRNYKVELVKAIDSE